MRFAPSWYLGTGFLLAPDLVLTNHHNLFDAGGAITRNPGWGISGWSSQALARWQAPVLLINVDFSFSRVSELDASASSRP